MLTLCRTTVATNVILVKFCSCLGNKVLLKDDKLRINDLLMAVFMGHSSASDDRSLMPRSSRGQAFQHCLQHSVHHLQAHQVSFPQSNQPQFAFQPHFFQSFIQYWMNYVRKFRTAGVCIVIKIPFWVCDCSLEKYLFRKV